MLESMRKGAQHPIVKALFFMLAIMFVVWGVGDIFQGNANKNYAATIGKTAITHAELDDAVRDEVAKYQQIMGKTLSEEEVERLGVKRYVLGQLVRNKITNTRANDLNIIAGKESLAQHIYNNDVFFNEQGKFDKERFKSLLSANGFTEEKYLNVIKQDIAVNTLLDALMSASVATEVMAQELFKFRNERRIADLIIVPPSVINNVAEPSEEDLVQYYHDNQDKFSMQEQRAMTYISFNVNNAKSNISVSEEKLRAEYQNSIAQYKTEEMRDVTQYLFKNEEEAKAAYEKIKNGNDKEFTKEKLSLDKVTKSSVTVEIEKVIFALKAGEVSQPSQGEFGWYVFVAKAIHPERVKEFEEVKKDIEKNLTEKETSNEFARFSNEIEDEFAAGKSMEEVAQKFDLVINKIQTVDVKGNGSNGSKVANIPDQDMLLPLAFSLDVGAPSNPALLSDNTSYVVVRVDSVVPKRVRALDEVKGIAIKMWKDQNRIKLLQEKSNEIVTKVREGEDIKNLASKMNLNFKTAQDIKRPNPDTQGGQSEEPVMMVQELFNLKKIGDITSAYSTSDGNFVIGRLVKIIKSDSKTDNNSYINILAQLEDEARDDILAQYINYLQDKYPVSIKTGSGNTQKNNQ